MKPFRFFSKISILVIGLIFFISTIANATTWYSYGNRDPSVLTNWFANTSGGGGSPSNFTTVGDIFIVQSSNIYTTAAGWTVTGSVQVSGTLTFAYAGVCNLGDVTVNSGGNMKITNSYATYVNNMTVVSGGILTQNQVYVSPEYLQVQGNLSILGSYVYTGFTPAIIMANAGTHYVNTGTTSVYRLLLRTGNYYANGPVTVNYEFFAMWDMAGGSFHTNGQTVNANWGVVISGGTLYVDGGTLTVGNTVGGMLIGRTASFNGDLQVISGTLSVPGGGIYLGNPGTSTPIGTVTQTGGTITTGTINTGALDIGGNCVFTHVAGTNNINGFLTLEASTSKYTHTTGTSTVNISGNLTNNGTYSTGTGTAAINIAGNWSNNNIFTTSTANTVTFNGTTAAQSIGGTSSTTFNNLLISNAAGVNLANAETVNTTLTLTTGVLNIGAYNLTLASTANAVAGSAFSASNMIAADGGGEVRKGRAALGSYLFPIGNAAGTPAYSPITINYTAGTLAGGAYGGIKVNAAKHPNNASTTDYLNRYWTVSNSGITSPSFNVTANYVAGDIAGTEANIAAAKYTGSLPWVKYAVIGSNTLTATAVTNTGTGIVFSGISNILPTASISGGATVCLGSGVPLASSITNATSSISYLWSPSTGLSSATVANPTATPATTTTYTLTVNDGNGFTGTSGTTTVTVATFPAAPTASVTAQPTCTVSTGTITITAPTGAGITYSKDGVTYTNTTGVFSGMTSGNYNLTAKNSSGCISAITTVTVNAQPARPAAPTITAGGPTTFCTGGSVTLTSSAGTTYLWSTGATTASISPTTSGNYSVQVTNASGCQSASSAATVVTVNALPAISGTLSICAGSTTQLTGSGTASASSPWVSGTTGVATVSNTGLVSGVSAGSSVITYTNNNNCSITATVTVNALPATPTITAGGLTTFCTGGSVPLTSSAGTSYLWSTGATTASISPTTSGSYSVQVTNASGCQSASSAAKVVTVNALPTISGTLSICAGSTTQLTGSGTAAASSPWVSGTTGVATVSNSGLVSGVSTGSSIITYTNNNGCTITATVTVNALPAATISYTGSPYCSTGGTANVTLTGTSGGTYTSTSGLSITAATGAINLSASTPGTYVITYTIAASGGCSLFSTTATIQIGTVLTNNQLDYTNGTHGSLCQTPAENGNAVFSAPAGTVFTTVNFASYGTPNGSCGSFTINPSCNATTSQSVTEGYMLGINSATIPATNVVFSDPCTGTVKKLYIQATYTQPICSGTSQGIITGTTPIGGTGTYIYYWEQSTTSSSAGFSAASGINNTINYTPGNLTQTTWYRRTVNSGCSNVSPVIQVTVNATPAAPTITAGGPTTFCTGGSVTLTSSAGTTYLWSTGATTASINATTSGSYSVQVTNASGCQSASSAATVVTVNALPAAPTASVTAQPSCTVSTGTITITAPAGAGITYSTDGVTYTN
ncbi:MAG: hypothetical protein M3Z26_02610, partial [Bacteroidota bacterium]|nr:hypothetical protein [Bacteroidota bacterium]